MNRIAEGGGKHKINCNFRARQPRQRSSRAAQVAPKVLANDSWRSMSSALQEGWMRRSACSKSAAPTTMVRSSSSCSCAAFSGVLIDLAGGGRGKGGCGRVCCDWWWERWGRWALRWCGALAHITVPTLH